MRKLCCLSAVVVCCAATFALGDDPENVPSQVTTDVASRSDQHVPSESLSVVDRSTLDGKVMCGYQGWFNCDGDGADFGWKHWARNHRKPFAPGNVAVDLWPDLSEFDADERFATGFQHADRSVAKVFSSAHQKTVRRHCRWMQEYGIDGVFVQRFASTLSSPIQLKNRITILSHLRSGAKEFGRVYSVMYDLSRLRAGETSVVRDDWKNLRSEMKVASDSEYLHHNGKPLVAVWGIGFSDDRKYTLRETFTLVQWLKSEGCSVMLGVPTFWREGKRDAVDDPMLHEIIRAADVVSPWTVGRYQTPKEASQHTHTVGKADLAWCRNTKVDYLPVIFPGFSWHNLNGSSLAQIPRLKGQFFWSRVAAAKRIGCKMIYVAMFDEVDEGTAIFKCTNDPPVGDGIQFLDYEGLPSDFYLRLTGHAAKVLRDQAKLTDSVPSLRH